MTQSLVIQSTSSGGHELSEQSGFGPAHSSSGHAHATPLMSTSEHAHFAPNFNLAVTREENSDELDSRNEAGEADSLRGNNHNNRGPLPMPEYGGWFAPLTEFLPPASQAICSFHR